MKEVKEPTMYLGKDNSRHKEQKIQNRKIHFFLRKKMYWVHATDCKAAHVAEAEQAKGE